MPPGALSGLLDIAGADSAGAGDGPVPKDMKPIPPPKSDGRFDVDGTGALPPNAANVSEVSALLLKSPNASSLPPPNALDCCCICGSGALAVKSNPKRSSFAATGADFVDFDTAIPSNWSSIDSLFSFLEARRRARRSSLLKSSVGSSFLSLSLLFFFFLNHAFSMYFFFMNSRI